MNRQPDLFGKVVFDGYDFGDQLQFLEGANKLLLSVVAILFAATIIQCFDSGVYPKTNCFQSSTSYFIA